MKSVCLSLPRQLNWQVEEIAKYALNTYSVSQAAELRQYLEQFLGQSQVLSIGMIAGKSSADASRCMIYLRHAVHSCVQQVDWCLSI